MYKLGEKVLVRGKLVKRSFDPAHISDVTNAVLKLGITAISKKYEVKEFEFGKSKEGIIVGVRSVADTRYHYAKNFGGNKSYITKTTRKQVYLIATDLKGLIYVPFELVTSVKEIDRLCKVETRLELLDDDEIDWDELDDDFDEYEEELSI